MEAPTAAAWSSGLHKKSLKERLELIELVHPTLAPHLAVLSAGTGALSLKTAELMIENVIGTLALPLAVAPGLKLNGKEFLVPMAVEEPSIVAAVTAGLKIVAGSSEAGFVGESSDPVMTAQVVLSHSDFNLDESVCRTYIGKILENEKYLLDMGNTFCKSMYERGGGMRGVRCRIISDEDSSVRRMVRRWICVELDVDVREAMGANIVTAVAEGLAPELSRLCSGARALLRILTNQCLHRTSSVKFQIPVASLTYKGVPGEEVAALIEEAAAVAAADPARAVTHNKGILNAIDAAAVACGQDWRAIEAAAHSYAARQGPDGRYGALSKYSLSEDGKFLNGELTMPIAVGVKGGAIQTHPGYSAAFEVLGCPDVATISQILLAVGLAANLSALKALSVEGILRGHMSLHARNIAIAAGAPPALVNEVCEFMSSRKTISRSCAETYLKEHAFFARNGSVDASAPTTSGTRGSILRKARLPSTLTVTIRDTTVSIAFRAIGPGGPQHICMAENEPEHPLQGLLLGKQKGLPWLSKLLGILNHARFESIASSPTASSTSTSYVPRIDSEDIRVLKIVSILLNLLSRQLMFRQRKIVGEFLVRLSEVSESPSASIWKDEDTEIACSDEVLSVGLPLLEALSKKFRYSVDSLADLSPILAHAIFSEHRAILQSIAVSGFEDEKSYTPESIEDLLKSAGKRMQMSLVLLFQAATLNPVQVTEPLIEVLKAVGRVLETEVLLAHDVSRWNRESEDESINVYSSWLRLHGKEASMESAAEFYESAGSYLKSIRDEIEKLKAETKLSIKLNAFEEKFLDELIAGIRQYYKISQ